MLGVAAQHPFGHAHEHVEPAGGLQHRGAADDGDDRQHHLDRRFARRQPEHEDEDDQADAADEAQAHASAVRPDQQTGQDDGELENDENRLHGFAPISLGIRATSPDIR